MRNKILQQSRRRFLEFAGKSGISGYALKTSSLLAGLMANRYAQADANKPVRRVVFVYTPLGTPNSLWLPTGNQLNAATRSFAGLESICHFHETEVVGGGFGQIWKALAEVRYVKDWTSNTLDHQIATVLGTATPFPTLHFGVQTQSDSFSFKNLQPVRHMENPAQVYDALFGAAGAPAPAHFQLSTRKRNILDAHLQAINCSRAQLSSAEKTAIDEYENSLAQLQGKLDTQVDARACYRPNWNSQGFSLATPDVRPAFAEQAYLQAEIISHALACGLTNVATLQLGDDQGSFTMHDSEFPGDMHQATCGVLLPGAYVDFLNYLGRCIAYLIQQLAEKDDPAVPGTKLLDNTVVVQVSSHGDGPTHSGDSGPILIATRMPSFKTGLATRFKGNSDTNLRALQSVAAGLGLEQFIGKESHHCIWPAGERWGGVDTDFLT